MTRLSLLAIGAAIAALSLGAAQAQAHEAPGDVGYADEASDCGRDAFTIIGAHAGATVLGFNAGVGGHFGVGDGCHGHGHHHGWRAEAGAEASPPPSPGQDPYPAAYPQAPWGAPYAYRTYGPQQAYGPPPPPHHHMHPPMYGGPMYGPPMGGPPMAGQPPMYGQPCGCMDPRGW